MKYYPYIVPGAQFGHFSGYSPQYPVRPYHLYPSYNPWHHHHHGGWGHGEWTEQWNNGYSGATITRWPSWPAWPPKIPGCGYTGYKTNKFDRKRNVEKGGWVAAWADDIAEKDVLQGIVAAGVSVFSSNPGPFLTWIENLVTRTISSLKASAQQVFTREIRNQIEELAADVIKQAIQGRSAREALKEFKDIGFNVKAGAIEYSGKNMACGKTITSTWGMKPYIAIRVRHV
ncbi:hypothetical protein [Paenibacillus elgii]|uniref:hypothetical protein n=1 Tax=Paenibacillus elgii TaxID=189691 RepID=UPI0009DA6DBC|nr:hypothetical protein [Paenibacillus elgii]